MDSQLIDDISQEIEYLIESLDEPLDFLKSGEKLTEKLQLLEYSLLSIKSKCSPKSSTNIRENIIPVH